MIEGRVNASNEAIVPIGVEGRNGRKARIETVVETGFNGHLTLPSRLIQRLVLAHPGAAGADLADGTSVSLDLFEATVLWDGKERAVAILQTESEALLGMAMLSGHHVTFDAVVGGDVKIEALFTS